MQKEDEEDNLQEKDIDKSLPKDNFSLEDFKLFWLEYLSQLKSNKKNKSLFNVLDTVQWRLTQEKNIEFTFDSSTMILEFEQAREHFLKALRTQLNNYSIMVITKVSKSNETKNHIKTRREIFQELVDKNPSLELLRKKFNLNIDNSPD
ncbi:MAG: hypothetical protein Q4G27_00195 [Flavobacteriaceae bacterium]|nr:hypothetical protein [Flavobacteriaceae bacterium]